MSTVVLDKDKKADLTGPGISDLQRVEKNSPARGFKEFLDLVKTLDQKPGFERTRVNEVSSGSPVYLKY